MRSILLLGCLLALAAVFLAGCGSGSATGPRGGYYVMSLRWGDDVQSLDFTSMGFGTSINYGDTAAPAAGTHRLYWVSNFTGANVLYRGDVYVQPISPYSTRLTIRTANSVLWTTGTPAQPFGNLGNVYDPSILPAPALSALDDTLVNSMGRDTAQPVVDGLLLIYSEIVSGQ